MALRFTLLAAAALAQAPTSPAPQVPAPGAATTARLPGFSAELANRPLTPGPQAWRVIPTADAWRAIARATPATRQSARWDYATSLLAQSRGAEASGALSVMRGDDPDLDLVPAFTLARGAALAMAGRSLDALTLLGSDELARAPEACAWRLRAFADSHDPARAVGEVACALPAINARTGAQRRPFVIAAAQAALEINRPSVALGWLGALPDGDPVANLWRGRAYLALHQFDLARLRFGRAALAGDPVGRSAARLGLIEVQIPPNGPVPARATAALDDFLFAWRGGAVEERGLRLSLAIADRTHDLRRGLRAGATLFRYFPPGPGSAALLASTQARLAQALAPDSALPLDQAAGLYWDYRDLAPAGAEGDTLVDALADRLETAGLYARAAQLLSYQLTARAQDVTQGPLSARVARLLVLAGQPAAAVKALRLTAATPYPQAMQIERGRVEAVALHLLGRDAEAMAVLEDIPGGKAVQQELLWQRHDWAGLLARDSAALPTPGGLGPVQQVVVLRHAVALAMLDRQPDLARLHARYAKAFAALPSAAAFDALTKPGTPRNLDLVSKALAALPNASPAGATADLIDAAPKEPVATSRS
jgi:tetratricopeptide (TPR) repeat protein